MNCPICDTQHRSYPFRCARLATDNPDFKTYLQKSWMQIMLESIPTPNLTDEEETYITLFCEGDGSLCIDRRPQNDYPKIIYTQNEREVLDHIHNLVNLGNVSPDKKGWRLQINGRECFPLLKIFSRHTASKQFLDKLNTLNEMFSLSHTVQHPIDVNGLTGFWDAEGSSEFTGSLVISTSQKDREILDIIVETFEGNVTPCDDYFSWNLSGEKARKLALELLSRSHHPTKRAQLYENLYPSQEVINKVLTYHREHYQQNKESIKEQHRVYDKQQRLLTKTYKELTSGQASILQNL